MGGPNLQDLKQVADDAVRALARASGVKTYVLVVAGNGQVFKTVSADLKAHERGLVDEIEKASANPIVVWDEGNPASLKRAEEGLAKTKHAELHPIVAVMIESLNKLNNHKVSRSTALKDSSSTPAWWPHNPKKYAERTQQLNIKDLTLVIDAVFAQVRSNAARIEKLRSMLSPQFKSGSCSLGTRAVFDAYFDFLLDDACRTGTAVAASGANLANANGSSETSEPLKESPRVIVSGNHIQALGLPALQASPTSNVHRPLPIHQAVPEFTKQELCVPLTGQEMEAIDVGPLPARRTSIEVASLPRLSSKEGATSAIWSAPGVFTAQEYVERDERRKRARTDVVCPGPDWSSYSAPSAAPILLGPYNPSQVGASVKDADESRWPKTVETGATNTLAVEAERPSAIKAESGDASIEQCAERVTEALQQLAEAERAPGCMWMLFGGNGTKRSGTERNGNGTERSGMNRNGKRMWCSPNLAPVMEALVEGLEVAISSHLQDAPADDKMANASNVLGSLVRSPSPSESTSPSVLLSEGPLPSKLRRDLAFVVEALVKGMNRIASSQELPDPCTIPKWFPYPAKYWTFTEELEKAELLHVLDTVFQRARGEYFHIRELKAQWHATNGELHNVELRRAVDAYLDGLEMEATTLLPHKGV